MGSQHHRRRLNPLQHGTSPSDCLEAHIPHPGSCVKTGRKQGGPAAEIRIGHTLSSPKNALTYSVQTTTVSPHIQPALHIFPTSKALLKCLFLPHGLDCLCFEHRTVSFASGRKLNKLPLLPQPMPCPCSSPDVGMLLGHCKGSRWVDKREKHLPGSALSPDSQAQVHAASVHLRKMWESRITFLVLPSLSSRKLSAQSGFTSRIHPSPDLYNLCLGYPQAPQSGNVHWKIPEISNSELLMN